MGDRGKGGSAARSSRRAGVADELARRIEWLERHLADVRAREPRHSSLSAISAELSALRAALAIVTERTLPDAVPFNEPTPALLDEWRQLGSWPAGRQVAVLCDALKRLSAPGLVRVADAFRAAHHAERMRGKPPRPAAVEA